MIGKKCRVCDKIIREHTKCSYVHQSSSKLYNQLIHLAPLDGQKVFLKANCDHNDCTNSKSDCKIIGVYRNRIGDLYIEEKVGKLYLLSFCSEECFEIHKLEIVEKRLERIKHTNAIKKLFSDISAKCDGRCLNCGSTDHLEVHHIIPFSKGGKAEIGNLVLLCQECHRIASGKSSTRLKKWLLNHTNFQCILNPQYVRTRAHIEMKIVKFRKTLTEENCN